MKLDQYIKELLTEKDSIIIKDFGAFEKVLQSAEIDEESGEIKPPHVTLKFDPSLKTDSGTLSKYVAAKLKISEQEAAKQILEQIKIWENELKEGKTIHLEGLGFIKIGAKGAKIFNAKINSGTFPDMYGLPVITVEKNEEKADIRKQPIRKTPPTQKSAVNKDKKVAEKEKTAKKTTAPKIVSKEEKEQREKTRKKLIITTLIVVPLIIIGVLVTLNFDLVQEKFNSGSEYVSGLLSGDDNTKEQDINERKTDKADTNKIAEIDNLDSTANNEATNNENETQKILENYTVINAQTNETVSAGEQVGEELNIEIIAGSFKRIQNAKRFRNQLKNKGFSAKVLPKSNGLYRVSIGSFKDLKAAGAEIETVQDIDPTLNVWILLNK